MERRRKHRDGRSFLPEQPCEAAAMASEEDLLDMAIQYAVQAHGHRNTPALREQLRAMLREERGKNAA
jgi:hypothetical protein